VSAASCAGTISGGKARYLERSRKQFWLSMHVVGEQLTRLSTWRSAEDVVERGLSHITSDARGDVVSR
jgi:hypothetical protein